MSAVNDNRFQVPTAYREFFEAANLAFFTNQPEKNRELLVKASRMALSEGRLNYHEFFQGELSFSGNNLPDALKHYELALKEEPHNSLFLSNHAVALFLTGESEKATTEFRQALAENPDERHAILGLIAVLTETRQIQRAKELANGLLRNPALEDFYKFSLLESLVDLDEDKKALRLVNYLLRRFPGNIYCTAFKHRIKSKLTARGMMRFKHRPYLRAVLLCDSVRFTDGKPSCEGIFDCVNAFAFPAVTPAFFVFVSFFGRRWKNVVDIKIWDRAKTIVMNHSGKAFSEDLRMSTNVVINVASLSLRLPGPYFVEVRVDGKVIGFSSFVLQKVEPRPEYSADQVKKLLADPGAVKSVRASFKCGKCNENYTFQMNLDPLAPVPAPAQPFPDGDKFVCTRCGTTHDLRAIRLQAREILGRPLNPSQRQLKSETLNVDKVSG